jgi:hypothetical protein
MLIVVTVVAGIVGVVMLIAPSDTDDYFSWPIGPPPLAATVGAFYVASAILFALAAVSNDWFRVRGLCFGVLGLTLPTLVSTIYDRDVFDFADWQAWAWAFLFVGSPIAFTTVLIAQRKMVAPRSSPLPPSARLLFAILAIAYGILAVAALADPVRVGDSGPFPMAALSGRYIGCWAGFLAVLAAYSAIRNRRPEAFIPAVALTLWPLAALLAGLRSLDDLVSGAGRGAYLAVLVILFLASTSLVAATREGAPAES